MKVTVTGDMINDVTGRPDNTQWAFSSVLREGSDGSIITTRTKIVTPIAGKLTVELDPGPVIIRYGDDIWPVVIPENDVDLWDVIQISVGAPPDTGADALAAAVVAYFSAHPIDGGAP